MENKNIIKFRGQEFPASKYQSSIFDEIEHGYGNMVITAAAGSAKTTTIENCLRFIPNGRRSLFLAFNVSTVEKLKGDVEVSNSTMIATFHGLGNRILRENNIITKETNIDDFKYSRFVKENLQELSIIENVDELGLSLPLYVYNINSLINLSRYYLALRERDILKVAKLYGIEPIADEVPIARKALLWGKENISTIDHTDMIWLPNVLNLNTRKYRFDFIFIDEAQDTTIAHQQMVDKCFGRTCRFVAIGDPMQQINVWCGATEEAIENYKKRPNTKEMPLPISYRCPKKIVEAAKQYSPNIEAAENAEEGEIRKDVSPYEAKAGDMVICRIMSKLLDLYLKYLRVNKKAYLVGYNAVRQTYIDLIESSEAIYTDLKQEQENGLINCLERTYEKRKEQIMSSFGISEEEAIYYPELFNLYDSIESIKVLGEDTKTVEELKEKIETIFEGDEKDAVILSTVHKAKGLEANNIFILCPSLMPSALARKDWEMQAEKNLIYVAITRAKKTLNYIKEDKKGFFNNFSSNQKYTKDTRQQTTQIKLKEKNEEKEKEETNSKNNKKAGLKLRNLM